MLKARNPMTVKDIAEAMGISTQSASDAVKGLRERRMAHIHEWIFTDLWHKAALWTAGEGEDAPRPANDSRSYSFEYARRLQLEDDLIEQNLARERAAKLREALSRPAFRHPQDVAFFGPADREAA
jgi:hypothetical protein